MVTEAFRAFADFCTFNAILETYKHLSRVGEANIIIGKMETCAIHEPNIMWRRLRRLNLLT